MRPLGTFKSILANGYHGNDGSLKNFDFIFGFVFASSMAAEKKVINDYNFQIFGSDHLNGFQQVFVYF